MFQRRTGREFFDNFAHKLYDYGSMEDCRRSSAGSCPRTRVSVTDPMTTATWHISSQSGQKICKDIPGRRADSRANNLRRLENPPGDHNSRFQTIFTTLRQSVVYTNHRQWAPRSTGVTIRKKQDGLCIYLQSPARLHTQPIASEHPGRPGWPQERNRTAYVSISSLQLASIPSPSPVSTPVDRGDHKEEKQDGPPALTWRILKRRSNIYKIRRAHKSRDLFPHARFQLRLKVVPGSSLGSLSRVWLPGKFKWIFRIKKVYRIELIFYPL